MKITPCHDPNDFEVGLRHDLPQYLMLDGEGRITWPDTSFYVGHFAENYYEGFGCYRMRNEKLYKGRKFL